MAATYGKASKPVDLSDPAVVEFFRQALLSVVGLSCFWQMLRFSAIRQVFPGDVLEQTGVSRYYYGILAAVAALVLLATAVRRVGTFLGRPPVVLSSSAAFAAAACAVLAAGESAGAGFVALRVVCAASGALSFVCLLRSWMGACVGLCDLDYRVLVTVLALSSMLTLVFSCGNYVSDLVADFKLVVSVPVSAVCAVLVARRCGGGRRASEPVSARGEGVLPIALMAVFLILATVVRRMSGAETGRGVVLQELMCNYFFTVLYGIACLFIVAFVSRPRNVGLGLMVVCVLMLAAGYFVHDFLGEDALLFGSGLTTSARAWFEVLLFAACVLYVRGGRELGVATATFAAVEVVASLLRRLALPLAAWDLGVPFDDFALSASSVLCFALLVFCIVGLAWASMGGRDGSVPDARPEAGGSVGLAELFAHDYGLTAREAVIASYIARGYSSPAIAEAESLSVNTVTSHSRSIYTKLGVHSRQEIIELAERLSGSRG